MVVVYLVVFHSVLLWKHNDDVFLIVLVSLQDANLGSVVQNHDSRLLVDAKKATSNLCFLKIRCGLAYFLLFS
ncbi:hypothetical protein D1872_281310 [compost metagenome]